LLQLALLEKQNFAAWSQNSGATVEWQVRAQSQALENGRPWIADSKSFDRNALDGFLRDDPGTSGACSPQISAGSGEDTTVITTADDQGNWVSMIQSVHESFGCGIVADGTGVILNNRTQGFNLVPGHPNELAPNKRPAHTLSPAMVFRDEVPWLALGTPGGMGQTQFLAQILSNLIDFGMDVQQAIEAPRWQSKATNALEIEMRFPRETLLHLQNVGFKVKVTESWDFRMGGAEAILLDRNSGIFQAGADPRRDGYAIGY
jgi:gamma-glutamyltranspeptidase/glutathione hydrolase